jgi:hypothetical protein
MVLTVCFVLSPAIGVLVTVIGGLLRKLDAGVEASGPHDFTLREPALSSLAPTASIASRAYVRDDRETSLCVGRDGIRYRFDLGQTKTGIFLQRRLDRANQIDPLRQFRVLTQIRPATDWCIFSAVASSFETRANARSFRMRSLMVRSAATPRVSSHLPVEHCLSIRIYSPVPSPSRWPAAENAVVA